MHSTAVRRAEIEQEGRAIITQIAERESAKVFALKVGIKPRHSYNLREGETDTRWPTFVMMAMQYPELREAVGRWLGFVQSGDARATAAALEQIRRIVATMPEEGDQHGG